MNKIVFVILNAIVLSGCAGQLVSIPFEKQRLINYKIGDPLQVSIGDPIIDLENATVRNAYEALFDYQTPSLGLLGYEQIFIRKGDRFTAVVGFSGDKNAIGIRQEGPEKKQYSYILTPMAK